MNPEGYAPPAAEQLEPMSLEEMLHLPREHYQDLSLGELEAHEQQLHELLVEKGLKSKPFSAYSETLRPAIQKGLKNPDTRREMILDYVTTQASFARQRMRAERQAELTLQHRHHMALQAEAGGRSPEMLLARDSTDKLRIAEILHSAERAGAQQFAQWSRGRNPKKNYSESDARLVGKVEERSSQGSPEDKDFSQVTERLEATFGQGVKYFDVFGVGDRAKVAGTSKYDDIAGHADLLATLPVTDEQGNERLVSLGIDFSITAREGEQQKKLMENFSQPVRALRYGTAYLAEGQRFLPVVLTVDRRRALRLQRFFNLAAVSEPADQIHKELLTYNQESIAHFKDKEVFQVAVVEEALAQLRYQEEVAAERQVDPEALQDYQAMIRHLSSLLAERKNLQVIAHEKVEEGDVRDVYRLRNEEFVRNAPSRWTAAAGDPAPSHAAAA